MRNISFLVVLRDARLLPGSPDEELPLVLALGGCALQRLEWRRRVRVVLRVLALHVRGLVLHGALVLVGLHHRLVVVDVALEEVFALAPFLVALVVAPFHVLRLGLVSHCHGMDFLELGDLGDHHVEESELVEDFHHKRSSSKMADLYDDLSGVVLKKWLRKTGVARSCCGALPFVC